MRSYRVVKGGVPYDFVGALTWNVHSGSKWSEIRPYLQDWVKGLRPTIIVINEARNIYRPLNRWAEARGYHIQQERPQRWSKGPKPEQGSTALLIDTRRDDLRYRRGKTEPMTEPWTVFSHKQVHDPRRFEMGVFSTQSGLWRAIGDHWATNGLDGGNRAAAIESAEWLRRKLIVGHRADIATFATGDKNELQTPLIRWIEDNTRPRIAEKILVQGNHVDLTVANGIDMMSVDVLGKGPSDHRAFYTTMYRRLNKN